MGTVATYVYTCDRDGTVSEPVAAMPPGWSNANFQATTVPEPPPPPVEGQPPVASMPNSTSVAMLLCPVCTAAFGAAIETFKSNR